MCNRRIMKPKKIYIPVEIMEAQSDPVVSLLLQPHTAAITELQELCEDQSPTNSDGRFWIHRESCRALASIFKVALTVLQMELITAYNHKQSTCGVDDDHTQDLLLLIKPALDMVLAAILQGKQFIQSCRPPVAADHNATSPISRFIAYLLSRSRKTASNADDQKTSWLLRASLKGINATDATDVHLHDFLLAVSAVSAAIKHAMPDLRPQSRVQQFFNMPDLTFEHMRNPEEWPSVMLARGAYLDKHVSDDDSILNSELIELHAVNCSHGISQDDKVQLAAFVREKKRWDKQACQESIDLGFLPTDHLAYLNETISKNWLFTIFVHKVSWLGKEFALKIYKECETEKFLQEAKIQVRLHHPNVIPVVALFKAAGDQQGHGVLMELMDEDLGKFLKRQPCSLSLQEKISIMLKIAKGMAYVHGWGVIHRDLKPSNVLVRSSKDILQACGIHGQQLEVKIADFGESRSRSLDSSTRFSTKKVGTHVYRAPEVLDEEGTPSYSLSADVYSYAMICYQLLVEEVPFDEYIAANRIKELSNMVIKGERPDLMSIGDDVCPPYLKHCLQTWWAGDPKTRHSFRHICRILRHLYACVARSQRETEIMVEFPFLRWPFWRWEKAQDIAQVIMRRANAEWQEKGLYVCESTGVNEIPYEMQVMEWAIKQAASNEEEASITEAADISQIYHDAMERDEMRELMRGDSMSLELEEGDVGVHENGPSEYLVPVKDENSRFLYFKLVQEPELSF